MQESGRRANERRADADELLSAEAELSIQFVQRLKHPLGDLRSKRSSGRRLRRQIVFSLELTLRALLRRLFNWPGVSQNAVKVTKL